MQFAIPDNFPIVYTPDHAALIPLCERGDLLLFSTRHQSQDELIARMAGATAAINVRAYSRFDAAVFAALPDLRFLTVMGTGTDNIDLWAAAQHSVTVSNTPTAPMISVAEHTVALTLAAVRNLLPMDQALRAGRWQHMPGVELHGKTFGFIGLGLIAAPVSYTHLTLPTKA